MTRASKLRRRDARRRWLSQPAGGTGRDFGRGVDPEPGEPRGRGCVVEFPVAGAARPSDAHLVRHRLTAANLTATTHGGFELEQSVTRGFGLVARFSAYQLYKGTGYDSPISPATNGPFFYGRFEGGIDLTPIDGTHLTFVGGNDVGRQSFAGHRRQASRAG